jgi:hypothetical protein
MPVIGGYLAFIGYFCFEAGVALAIGENIMSISDWMVLYTKPSTMILALPTLVAGVVLTYITRNVKNDIALPCAMIVIPSLFYVIIWVSGIGMDGARAGGWMGGKWPPLWLPSRFFFIFRHMGSLVNHFDPHTVYSNLQLNSLTTSNPRCIRASSSRRFISSR